MKLNEKTRLRFIIFLLMVLILSVLWLYVEERSNLEKILDRYCKEVHNGEAIRTFTKAGCKTDTPNIQLE